MNKREEAQVKYLVLIVWMLLVATIFVLGCSTPAVNMDHCKKACKGQVQHYQDDEVDCQCKDVK